MSDRPTTFEALIPDLPDSLRLVLDRDGDVWQRQDKHPSGEWACAKPKIPALIGAARTTQWRHLVYAFGPLTAVHWDEAR